jgi:hypothetical protein
MDEWVIARTGNLVYAFPWLYSRFGVGVFLSRLIITDYG